MRSIAPPWVTLILLVSVVGCAGEPGEVERADYAGCYAVDEESPYARLIRTDGPLARIEVVGDSLTLSVRQTARGSGSEWGEPIGLHVASEEEVSEVFGKNAAAVEGGVVSAGMFDPRGVFRINPEAWTGQGRPTSHFALDLGEETIPVELAECP